MNIAEIPLAAKLCAGGVAALALLGGGIAAGSHLVGAAAPSSTSPSPVVASPTPAPASPAAGSAVARATRQAVLQAEAQVLGITVKQLQADFKSGQSVQQLATAKGLSQDQFRTQLVPVLTPLLDKEVTAGTLTSAQEQTELMRIGKTIPNWVRAAPRAPASPSPTP